MRHFETLFRPIVGKLLAAVAIVLTVLAGLGWGYRGIWAVDPLSVPAANQGWAVTSQARAGPRQLESATFAAGCFWGVEAVFRNVPGVIRTRVGYTGGSSIDPSYLSVESQRSGHAEAVDVEFDPAEVNYSKLLDTFFNCHDPTVVDRSEYRSAIFYHSDEQRLIAMKELHRLVGSGEYVAPLATQIVAAGKFYPAEDYHQRYYERRGSTHVCQIGNGKRPATHPAE